GGKSSVDNIKSYVMKGAAATLTQNGAFEAGEAAPGRGYESLVTQGGRIERSMNGAVGWERDAQGVREIPTHQLADLKRSFQLFRNLRLKDQLSRMRVSGKDSINIHYFC